jgi:glycosyltransferase involved in cell wall biosynthesis
VNSGNPNELEMEAGQRRVLHLVISLACGGLENMVVGLTRMRNRAAPGSTVVACLDGRGALSNRLPEHDVLAMNADRTRFPFDTVAVMRLRELLSGQGGAHPAFHILHSHNLAALQYGALACWGNRIRHIHTEHGTITKPRGLTDLLRRRWLYGQPDRVTAVAPSVITELQAAKVRLDSPPLVVANGVDTEVFNPLTAQERGAARQAAGLPDGAIVVGALGRMSPEKGFDRLLTAMARLSSENGGAQLSDRIWLVLGGDGPVRKPLDEQAHAMGWGGRVRFAGFVANPRDLYALIDVFVLPSRSEGLSLSLLEAISAGVPVLATACGDHGRVVGLSKAGWLLPASDAEWPAAILAACRGAWEFRLGMPAASAFIRREFGLDRTLAAYESMYEARGSWETS